MSILYTNHRCIFTNAKLHVLCWSSPSWIAVLYEQANCLCAALVLFRVKSMVHGIVPGQKYSPATGSVCGARRKNRRRCCLACLPGLSRRPQVTQLYHRPTVFLPTNFSLQFVFISHHLHMYNLPLPSTQKIGIIVKTFVPSTVQYRSSREIWPKNLATAMSTNALFCKKVCSQSACKPTYQ